MQKSLSATAVLLAAGMMLAGSILAQQTPSSTTSSSTPAKTTTGTTVHKSTTATKTATAPLELKTDKDKISYALGTDIGTKLRENGLDVDPKIVMQAFQDAFNNKKLIMTQDEINKSMMQLAMNMRQKGMEKQKEEADKNKKAGDDFRAANKTKDGVVTLPDGLQYKILQAGTGPKPTAQDQVVCNYKGTFIDGKVFDSSYDRHEPLTIPVGGVIKGWTEALQLMPVGSKWQLVIPPDLAYGDKGGQGMPPNSTLVFEVELMKIADKGSAPAGPQDDKSKQPQSQN